jgi:uncharacterized protein (DUF302 family)
MDQELTDIGKNCKNLNQFSLTIEKLNYKIEKDLFEVFGNFHSMERLSLEFSESRSEYGTIETLKE